VRSLLLFLVLTMAGLTTGGCVTAGLALMGPLAGSVTAIADRSVDRTMPADLGTTWRATADALARMAIRVDQAEKSESKWRLTGTGEAATLHSTLERVTAGMTKVSVRVEGGGLFADKQTSEEILNQIAASLTRLASSGRHEGTAPGSNAVNDELRGLQRQIERLGTKIEQVREVPPVTPRPEASPAATMSTPIIVVPASAGVAIVPAATVSTPRPTPPPAADQSAARNQMASQPPLRVAPPREPADDGVVAAPMKAVEALRPVEALQIRPVRE
jgi:hypothetical protein